MKKVLFTASVDEHISQFHMNYIKWFQEKGYEVHAASNGEDTMNGVDRKFNVPFSRQPMKVDSLEAYRIMKKLVRDNHYDIVHCHTPMAAVLTRLATRNLRKEGVQVLYTAHGFHFFKGSSAVNWALYYPVEKLLSRYTDCLITINPEDFNTANERKFKSKDIKYVHGVGVDLSKFHPVSSNYKNYLRQQNGYDDEDFLIITVGELSHRKNQEMIIRSMQNLIHDIPEARLLIVGDGELEQELKAKAEELSVRDKVDFLGYRKDIDKLMQMSDVAVSCSRQEGLPVNIMEAMATGLPIVVTDCRGNRDLVMGNLNGYKVSLGDEETMSMNIKTLYEHSELRNKFGQRGLRIIEDYSDEMAQKEMNTIYTFYIDQASQAAVRDEVEQSST